MRKWIVLVLSSYFVASCGSNSSNNNPAPTPGAPMNPYVSAYNGVGNGNYGYGYPTNGGPYASTPMGAGCLNGGMNCQMNLYNQGQMYGFTPYQVNPYSWGGYYNYYNQSYGGMGSGFLNFCNCPSGYRPVYNGVAGLGCVQVAMIQPMFSAAIYWGLGPNNYQWTNWNQRSNITPTGNGGLNNGCFSNVAQSCFVDQSNSCGPGAFCQVTAAGSRIGLCVGNGSNGGAIGVFR